MNDSVLSCVIVIDLRKGWDGKPGILGILLQASKTHGKEN